MNEITLLVGLAVLMGGVFAMAGLRLWFITHQDVNMSKKVNGLCIDVGKIKKQLREGSMNVQTQSASMADLAGDAANMDIGQFVEMMGFDPKELDNPIVRPLAEKIFKQFQSKGLGNQETNEPVQTIL